MTEVKPWTERNNNHDGGDSGDEIAGVFEQMGLGSFAQRGRYLWQAGVPVQQDESNIVYVTTLSNNS